MKSVLGVGFVAGFVLVSCSTSLQQEDEQVLARGSSEWMDHPSDPVPNILGRRSPKRFLRNGFYEQGGSVLSSASWESVAHYTYLGRDKIQIGIAHPYSISPSGRFAVIPEEYVSESSFHVLKIYDSRHHRFVRRKVQPGVIRSYDWSDDERVIRVSFEDRNVVAAMGVPEY